MAPKKANTWIYMMPPIDDWTGWTKLEVGPQHRKKLRWYSDLVTCAGKELLNLEWWEGDGSWYLSALPMADQDPALILAIKQQNNGTTFVISQTRLPHLELDSCVEKACTRLDWSHGAES